MYYFILRNPLLTLSKNQQAQGSYHRLEGGPTILETSGFNQTHEIFIMVKA